MTCIVDLSEERPLLLFVPQAFLVTWVFPPTLGKVRPGDLLACDYTENREKGRMKISGVLTKAFKVYLHSISFLRIFLLRPFSREVKITPITPTNSFRDLAGYWAGSCPDDDWCKLNAILSSKERSLDFMTLSLCWPRVLLLSGVG